MSIVALVNPNRLRPGVQPLALEYLAAELEHKGIEVRILDLCRAPKPLDAIRAFFLDFHPDLIGITIRNLDDVVYDCFLAGEMKYLIDAVKQASDAPIVLGGSGFSIAPEMLLDFYGIEMGVVGEGEEALPMILEGRSDVPGLVCRDGRLSPLGCADVNSLHLARRGRLDYPSYSYKAGRKGGAGVQTKRGCPNKCIYCVVPNIEGSVVRLRDPASIADEIESLVRLGRIGRVFIADSEFNYPRHHAMGVCEEFIARGIAKKVTWQAYASPGEFDLDLAKKMKGAGCDLLITTVDCGDDTLLERLNKPFRVEDIKTCIKACTEAELNAIYCLTLGGPGETMETVFKTLDLMRSMKAKVTFGEPPGLRIYPGTPLEAIVREEGFNRSNPNLRGRIEGNENLLMPVYYLSSGMGLLNPGIQLRRKLGKWYHSLKRA